MYAIIREGEGKYYTSTVFGIYRNKDNYLKNRYIVLNKEKNKLIIQYEFKQNTRYIIPMILVTDTDKNDWNILDDSQESLAILPTIDLLDLIMDNNVPNGLLKKCIVIDKQYNYEDIKSIQNSKDIYDLEEVAGGFHDAFISQIKEENDSLYVLFDGAWGCQIEVWFKGDVTYDISSRDPEFYDQYWFDSKIVLQDDYVYLIDDEYAEIKNLTEGYCWFKARTMQYRIIPD